MSDYIPGALGVFLDGKKDDKPKKKKKLITKKVRSLLGFIVSILSQTF